MKIKSIENINLKDIEQSECVWKVSVRYLVYEHDREKPTGMESRVNLHLVDEMIHHIEYDPRSPKLYGFEKLVRAKAVRAWLKTRGGR